MDMSMAHAEATFKVAGMNQAVFLLANQSSHRVG